jgi:hypothetical protein
MMATTPEWDAAFDEGLDRFDGDPAMAKDYADKRKTTTKPAITAAPPSTPPPVTPRPVSPRPSPAPSPAVAAMPEPVPPTPMKLERAQPLAPTMDMFMAESRPDENAMDATLTDYIRRGIDPTKPPPTEASMARTPGRSDSEWGKARDLWHDRWTDSLSVRGVSPETIRRVDSDMDTEGKALWFSAPALVQQARQEAKAARAGTEATNEAAREYVAHLMNDKFLSEGAARSQVQGALSLPARRLGMEMQLQLAGRPMSPEATQAEVFVEWRRMVNAPPPTRPPGATMVSPGAFAPLGTYGGQFPGFGELRRQEAAEMAMPASGQQSPADATMRAFLKTRSSPEEAVEIDAATPGVIRAIYGQTMSDIIEGAPPPAPG